MWHSIELGNGAEALGPTQQIMQKFMAAFMAARGDINMAIFSRSDLETINVAIYFSPAAAIIAKTFNGVIPCGKPSRKGLGLLAGDQRCWKVLFPSE